MAKKKVTPKNWIEVAGHCVYLHIGRITAEVARFYSTPSEAKRCAHRLSVKTDWPIVET